MKVLLLTGLGALFFAYYWADSFDPASLQGARVLLTGASAGVGEELAYHCARLGSHLVLTARTEAFLQKVNFLSYVQLTSLALPSLKDSQGSLVVVSSLLGRVPTSFSSPYSAAKFALDSFFGSLQRELDVQDVNVAITICVLGLQDRTSAKDGVRGVTRTKAALAVIRGSATRVSHVFYPWRFHVLCLLRAWLPRPRAWFIRQELMSLPLLLPELLHLLGEDPHPATLRVGHRDTFARVAMTQDSIINTGKENRKTISTRKQ